MKCFPRHRIVILVVLVILVSLASVLILGSCAAKATPPPTAPAAAATGVSGLAAPAPAATGVSGPAAPAPAAASASGACSNDPALSAISIQGGSDFEDTAEGFLTGHGTGGALMSSFKAPSTWSLRHLSSESQYFRDPERAPSVTASDADPVDGIDQAMLLFYAGHGDPEKFWTVDGNDQVKISDVRLGNCKRDGVVRYVWQCSCQVYAHGPDMGPKKCGGSGIVADPCYDNPGGWTATSEMNVFDRWGPALDPSVRMACGASTNAHCEGIGGSIWYNLGVTNTDVADAFIISIWNRKDVGLCITLGGEDMAATPLVTDLTFDKQPNKSGNSRYHIEYAQDFISETYSSGSAVYPAPPMPAVLPVFALDDVSTASEGGTRTMNVEPAASGYQEYSEKEYISVAETYLAEKGLSEEFMARPEGAFLRLASTPVKAEDRDKENPMRIGLKTVIVTYRQQLNVLAEMEKDRPIPPDIDKAMWDQLLQELRQREVSGVPVLGGAITVQLNNDSKVRSATKTWYRTGPITRMVEPEPYEAALDEARKALGPSAEGLEVGRPTWGYRPNRETGVSELTPYYEFWFVPKDGATSLDYPPQVIYVSAVK
jgi:hypothetical protein